MSWKSEITIWTYTYVCHDIATLVLYEAVFVLSHTYILNNHYKCSELAYKCRIIITTMMISHQHPGLIASSEIWKIPIIQLCDIILLCIEENTWMVYMYVSYQDIVISHVCHLAILHSTNITLMINKILWL